MYIDTHCHLNDEKFNLDIKNVITSAKKAGVKKFIVPGIDYQSSQKSLLLSQQYPLTIYTGVGFHPYTAQHNISIKPLEILISDNLKTTNDNGAIIAAIGEIGLDYHQYKGFEATGRKDNQKRLFADQCLLALKYNLPVIIHCREAFADIFDVLDSLTSMPKAVLHCFSGGLQDLREAQKRNLFVGIDGNITYSKQLQGITSSIPLPLLLLETDSPLLTPEPFRGTRNTPKNLLLVAKEVSRIKSVPLAGIRDQTTKNALRLFRLSGS